MTVTQKVCLIVIDGWGITAEAHGNAILNGKTPVMDKLMSNSILVEASEGHVGLPDGQMGNSEVGHLNIGAGRVIYQDIVKINMAISSGEILKNEALLAACERAKTVSGGRIHLLGLCSDGGVHSHIHHILKTIEACKKLGVKDCYLHCITDGRDTSPTSGVGFIKQILDSFKNNQYGHISTVVGRYYAMDRDKRWERVKVAFDAFCYGTGTATTIDKIIPLIQQSYAKGQKDTDEFLAPFILGDEKYRIKAGDTLIFMNYRSDRMREIVTSLGIQTHFDSKIPENLELFTMAQYDQTYPFKILFPPTPLKNVLAEWLASSGAHQLHVAETEKYPHVTFFFNGGVESQFLHEERVLVPSPKVPTYDLKPEMSVFEVGQKVVEGISSGKYSFIIVNLAPPDMVGHTGFYQATVQACEATDQVIGQIHETCEKFGFVLMVTADHGNAEKMYDDDDKPYTAHTLYPVPLIITKGFKLAPPKHRKAALCDISPTVLDVMGLPKPKEMEGVSLVSH